MGLGMSERLNYICTPFKERNSVTYTGEVDEYLPVGRQGFKGIRLLLHPILGEVGEWLKPHVC